MPKKGDKSVVSVSGKESKSIERLIESNIQLQHKMTDVLLGVKELNGNVSELVHVFKSAGEHIKSQKYEDPMINKINELLDENKKLAQALMMLEKMVRGQGAMPSKSPLEQSQY